MIWNTKKTKTIDIPSEESIQAEDAPKKRSPYYAPARAEAEEALEAILQKRGVSGFSEEELRVLSRQDAKEAVLARATQRLQCEYASNFDDDWDTTAIVKSCMRAQLQEVQEEMARD